MAIGKGTQHPSNKLSVSDVLAIRQTYGSVKLKETAAKYGVSITNIHLIISRKTWKHI